MVASCLDRIVIVIGAMVVTDFLIVDKQEIVTHLFVPSLDYMRCFYVFHASVLYEVASECQLIEKQRYYQAEMRRYFKEYKDQNASYPGRIAKVEQMMREEV